MANSTKLRWPTSSTTRGTQTFQNPAGHNGIDITASPRGQAGNPIYAAADGQVTHIVSNGGSMGNYVFVAHGSKAVSLNGSNFVRTQYLHLRETPTFISVGSSVSKGQVIGYMGDSGSSGAFHLHFDIKEKTTTGFTSTDGYTIGEFKDPDSYNYD